MSKRELTFDKKGWKKKALGSLAFEVAERVSDPEQSRFERFVGLEHFVSGDLKISKYSSTKGLVSAAKEFKEGDILFARRNAYLRRASKVEFSGVCSGDAFVLREIHENIVPGFLAVIVNSDLIWQFANENAEGTMSKRVKWRDLEGLEIRVPPVVEQREIMELINGLESSLYFSKRALEKLMVLKEALVKEVFFNDSGREKHHYKINDVVKSIVSGTSVNCVKIDFKEGDKGVLKTSSITGNVFDSKEVKVVDPKFYDKLKCSVEKEIILFNRKNTRQLVGSSKYMERGIKDIYLPDLIWSIEVNEEIILPKLFWFYLSSRTMRHKISSLSNGTNESMVNISQKQFLKIPVSLPLSERQKLYLDEFEKIEQLILCKRKKIETSLSLRKAIIQKVF